MARRPHMALGGGRRDLRQGEPLHRREPLPRGPIARGAHPQGDSPEGVRDLVGNVAEWTGDNYAAYSPSAPAASVPPDGLKVVRGAGGETPAWPCVGTRGGRSCPRCAPTRSASCAYSEGDTLDALRGALSDPEDMRGARR